MDTKKLSQKQNNFLNALLMSGNVSKAAQKAGVSRSSAFKWLKDPVFIDEMNSRNAETARDCMLYLKSKLTMCAETLVGIIESNETNVAVKLQAIQTVFSNAEKLSDQFEIAAKLDELERAIDRNEG